MQKDVTEAQNGVKHEDSRGCEMFVKKRNRRALLLVMLACFLVGFVCLGLFTSGKAWPDAGRQTPAPSNQVDAYLQGETLHERFEASNLYRNHPFSIEGNDVLVFLHIQKTGGTTFGKHLVKNLDIPTPCICKKGRKRCDCYNEHHDIWLFSRYSTGWACGLHADWTELQACIDQKMDKKERKHRERSYLYISMLRDPVYRFISEWKHVQRGSTWKNAELKCNGRPATLQEVPFCYTGPDWSEVTMDAFMACPSNLAINRQTRMLADLRLVNCYNASGMSSAERDRIMLQSAKDNLRDMAYFGLTEAQLDSQFLFECTFGLHFRNSFVQHESSHARQIELTDEQRRKVVELNHLDIELFQYAKDLIRQRLRYMQQYGCGGNVVIPASPLRHRPHSHSIYDNFEEEDDYLDEEPVGPSRGHHT